MGPVNQNEIKSQTLLALGNSCIQLTRFVKQTATFWGRNDVERMRFNDIFSQIWTCPGNELTSLCAPKSNRSLVTRL